jgi:hypothetical protein
VGLGGGGGKGGEGSTERPAGPVGHTRPGRRNAAFLVTVTEPPALPSGVHPCCGAGCCMYSDGQHYVRSILSPLPMTTNSLIS